MHKEISELCKPMQDYLRKNYDPYTEIVISEEDVYIKQTIVGIPKESDHFVD